ncbi:ABC transporter ATP-binding protein (plasmid) [Paroceanicella profunda]|uniref:ABC transporter ATP-binding protein n=1 Tax=Paroceanicella profunda TaxID=2579971 RepID=A0A5B8FJR3_9RHOB|nr:ABC transporter ATP-binding protein [Paroceanicella profunda]QDL94658.1 ABC transporter ATP-binding protein [Paroceanicella profunda]
MGAIRLEAVEKWFGAAQVIKGVDLEVADGEFVIFVGPSGCGKSTLLRLISGLEEVSRGHIRIDGRDVTAEPPSGRGLAMVFQSYALYPHMTVRENMGFGLKTAGAPKAEIAAKVDAAAQVLKLEPMLDRRPKDLSGGQRQRVAIGRSIVREPSAFLFDEPLSNLDASLRVEMRFEIAKLHRDLAATMIYVTHDQVEAMTLADKIVVLSAGQIEQVGSPRTLYERPDNLFVAQFIGSPKMNVMPCAVSGAAYALEGHGGAAAPAHAARATQLGIRPEHISLVEPGQGQCSGTVEVAEYLGADVMLFIDCGPLGVVNVRHVGDTSLRPGDRIGLAFDPERTMYFDAQDKALWAD